MDFLLEETTESAAVDRFVSDWQTAGDEPPDLRAFLALWPSLGEECVLDLALIDQRFRYDAGISVAIKQYRNCHSALCSREAIVSLLYEELCLTGRTPDWSELFDEYPGIVEDLKKQWEFDSEVFDRPIPTPTPERAPTIPGYRIEKRIGGRMAEVYSAWRLEDDQRCVLKFLRQTHEIVPGERADTRDRFNREIRILSEIEEPAVVRMYDRGVIDDGCFFTMEYIPGKDLLHYVDETNPPESAIAELLHQIAVGISAAHAREIIHRDLKPENILVEQGEEGPQARIIDFGLAKFFPGRDHFSTQDRIAAGALAYMAPEQLAGETKANPRYDIYSLGAMLYALITGEHPYARARGTRNLLAQIHEGPPPLPSRIRSGISPQLEAICLKAMAREPAERYAAAAEFAEALDSYRDA